MTYHRVKQMRVDRSEETRAWRDLRAAGQGVRAIRRFLTLAARGESLPAFEREASPKGDERCIPPGLLRSERGAWPWATPEYSRYSGASAHGQPGASLVARGQAGALSVLRRTFTTDSVAELQSGDVAARSTP